MFGADPDAAETSPNAQRRPGDIFPSPDAVQEEDVAGEGITATAGAKLFQWMNEQKAAAGAGSDEVPTCMARLEHSQNMYSSMSAATRGARVHNGPLKLRPSRKPADRTTWVRDDKRNAPYSYFENPSLKAPEPKTKASEPPKMWLPQSREEHAKEISDQKKATDKGEAVGGATSSSSKKAKSIEGRDPWDQEHHIMVSRANHELQMYCREYFNNPKTKEGQGVPKVRELYAMNDRQCGWCDEPAPLGESRRTHLNWVGAYNVGGPKGQQMPSYWRKIVKEGGGFSALPQLNATFGGITKSPSDQSFLERLSQMPADKSSQFWRDWVQHSKSRLPPKHVDPKAGKKAGKRGKGAAEAAAEAAAAMMVTSFSSPALNPLAEEKTRGPKPWNDRWSITHSKDNATMTKGQQQYFTSAQFLSGHEEGHPGVYLGMSGSWRKCAENVTHFPVGPEGRGPSGRRCLLT